MAITRSILDKEQGYSVLYNSQTMKAFGSIFYESENQSAEEFIDFIYPVKPHLLTEEELETHYKRYSDLKTTKQNANEN